MARFDKYDPISGGFRAATAIAWTSSDLNKAFAVGLNSSGAVVKGAGNSGVVGIVVVTKAKAIGDIIDVMTQGEIVEATLSDGTTALTAGTSYYGDVTSGALTATATSNKKLGYTVETTRLVVRVSPHGTGA
jgi:hypothetical protein